MPFDGSGTYTPAAAPNFPAVAGTTIQAAYYNAVINDVATAFNNCLTRDGQGKPSANITWNNKNLTGVATFGAVAGTFSTTLAVTGNLTAGSLTATPIRLARQAVKTIASGAIAVTSVDYHFPIDTEGGAASDDLVNITGGTDGQIIIIEGTSGARPITLKAAITSGGNISVPQDIVLTNHSRGAAFIYNAVGMFWTPIGLPYVEFTSTVDGLVPASGGGTTNFLRADGTWAAPAPTALNALTFNTSGGAAAGSSFDGSVALTVDYSTIGAAKTGTVTGSGLTVATGRLLGRTTAATGAIEEISVGATLTLAAGSLAVASVPNALTVSNSGTGVASGTTYNGATARTISWNSVGAAPIFARVQITASTATLTPTTDDDIVILTAQAVNLTIAAPTGSPTQGQGIVIRIKDNGTSRTITLNAIYREIGVSVPAATTIGKTLYLGMIYNATDTKWDIVSVTREA